MFLRATLTAAAIATAAIGSAPAGHSEPPCHISKPTGDCVPDPEQAPGGGTARLARPIQGWQLLVQRATLGYLFRSWWRSTVEFTMELVTRGFNGARTA